VDFYSKWSSTGDAAAPKVLSISGVGRVEEITARAMQALEAV
jgi:adenylate kinase